MLDRFRSNWLIPACVALVLLTLLAAHMQYRWINRVSEADRRQRHDLLAGTLRNFNGEFRETVLRPLQFFRLPPAAREESGFESALLERAKQWRSTADRPQLLKSISIGTQSERGVTFKRLRAGDGEFKEESWPNEFALYRTIVEQRLRMPGGEPPFFPRGFAFELVADRPVLIFPLVTGTPPAPEDQAPGGTGRRSPLPSLNNGSIIDAPPLQQPPSAHDLLQSLRPATAAGTMQTPELKGWCFLEVDAEYLRDRLLPELVSRHYGSDARSEYLVAIVAAQPVKIIYRSEPTLTTDVLSRVDAGIVLLEANLMQARPGPPPPGFAPPPPPRNEGAGERRPGPPPPPPPGPQPFVSGPQGVPLDRIAPGRGGPEDAIWVLVIKNKSGSLEALVEHSRRHNLVVSFGILLLLAGSIVMLMLTTTRARNLARQQMEFVAGVSHELRTPLTVIHSTSYNLSKGMIQDPNRVQQYGTVIQSEARRLINQVERMLSFAGIQSGRRIYDPQPLNVPMIIDRALGEYASTFANEGWQVEQRVADDLPMVLTDEAALESALKNLFENALKYAAAGKQLTVQASVTQSKHGSEVQITVADRGPGIPAKDLPHIFEPFYRGHEVIASSVSGAGLGLCLVERNMRTLGGRVTVKSSPTEGTEFTLHLPALDQAPAGNKPQSNEKQDPAD